MMRIVTGSAKGIRLQTLEGDMTRPTSERVKEAIFSSIQFDLEGRRVLDLFAGCGQLGLEAMSRGAAEVMFVDASAEAMAVVKANAGKTGFFSACRYGITDYRSYIRKASGRDSWNIIFIDPPYALHAVGDALSRILEADIAAPGALFVCESGEENIFEGHEDIRDRFTTVKAARYSITYITILRLRKDGADHV